MHNKKHTAGNVLIFLLIAIFLLGALTALFVRTSATTEETGETERVTIGASQIIRFASGVQTAVERMRVNGVSENQISFANTIYQECDNTPLQDAGHNTKCTSKACEIFSNQGGGLQPFVIPTTLLDTSACSAWKKGAIALDLKRVDGIGNLNDDELMLEIYGLSKETCMQINRILKIPNDGSDAPADDAVGGSVFSGTFTQAGPLIGDDYADFAGKKAFCLKSGGDYSFFTVLIAK